MLRHLVVIFVIAYPYPLPLRYETLVRARGAAAEAQRCHRHPALFRFRSTDTYRNVLPCDTQANSQRVTHAMNLLLKRESRYKDLAQNSPARRIVELATGLSTAIDVLWVWVSFNSHKPIAGERSNRKLGK